MSIRFKTVITTAGAAKLAAATTTSGQKVSITHMAVGDGNGNLPEPSASQTALIHEVWRGTLNKITQNSKAPNQVIAELVIPPEVGGFWMRELGLYDSTGTLIAVASMAESYKPLLTEGSGRAMTCRMIIIISDVNAVSLSVDSTTIMATQDYVDDKLAEHEQSRRHPDASLTQKGFTQLSSATDSNSESVAATPKAIKTLNDTKAPLKSPALTGTPTAPTAAQGTNNTQIATTAYVRAAISALVDSSPEALDTLNELAAALGNDPNFATTMTNALAGKQPLDATLTALAGLATTANKLPYFTGKDTVALADLTSVGRNILAKTSVPAVIQYLGLRELGTSGEKIPLLSTANTWSAHQTFNGGITGALTGNADTATKLKTARKINNVSFDGSADITLTPANLDVTSLTFMKNNGEMPVDADLNAFGPVEAYLGVWSKATSTNATAAKNFPEDGAVGVLEVFNGGNFSGMQRYTTRTGNVYMRNLSGTWNGSDGPWSYWRQIQSATRPLSTTIDLNTLGGADHLGLWRNSSGSIASFDRNYPEEGSYGQGLLEVLEGGGYSRTQRYTTRRGNVYVRCLSASWDAENPQWEPWSRVGYQSESRYYDGDLNDVTSPGIYSVTGKATNGPILDGNGVTVLGILEVLRRFDGVNVWQRYTTAGTGATLKGRTFERVYTGSSWSEWREVYTSYSLPLNLGIGGAVAKLTSLDWQTYDFVPGSLITVRLDNMTNIPDGMDWGVIDGNLINIAVGPSDDSGTGRSMHVWRSTVSKANYRFFMVRISGNPGSRTITTRRVPIIDEAQTWGAKQTFSAGISGELSGNAATATKLKTPRKINNVSFDGTSDINLTPKDIGAFASGKTGDTVANDKAVGWNWSSGAYNATIDGASTLILHFYMGEGSCPAAQFRINYKNGGIFYRSARDGYGFEADWSEFYTTTRKPSASDVGAYSKSESDSRYALKTACVTSVRLGAYKTHTMQKGTMFETAGYVITGLGIIGEVDGDDPARLRPLQYCINGTWYTAATA
ncbi:phage tail protein [Escherichia coli]|uniref:phage tail-collar fiber domain-containing protein n=1 Tax=Escherichia coli TaxID=562 RepID=UPI0010CC68B2|nr:phage tail protein [Escherichia coli]GCZ52548.1 phage tail protein [Escherichia coli]